MSLEKLRIGLIIDSNNVPNWVYHIVLRVVQSNSSQLVVVIKIKKNLESRMKKKNLLFQKLMAYDSQAYEVEQNALEVKSILDIKEIPNIQSISLSADESPTAMEMVEIKDLKLDVFIKFDTISSINQFTQLARYGVWYYYLGDYPKLASNLYGVQEFLEKQKVTKITLSAKRDNSTNEIKLFESYSRTDPHSIHRSLNNSYWKAVSFIPRRLQQLYQLGPIDFFQKIADLNAPPASFYNRPYKISKSLYLLKMFYRHLATKIITKIYEFRYFNQWILLFKLNNERDISTSFFEFTRITPPKDRFWADPFVIYKNSTYYIFVEEFIYKDDLGTIAVIEMDEQGNFKDPYPILKKDYHMSYPFIIEDNGKLYMLPETKGNETIELYECTDFPLKWKPKEVLFNNIRAVDSTIFKHSGKYWLFTNIQENVGIFTSDDELFLFYSDSLLNGNWTPHPQNPIVSDVRYARPAGKIIVRNNRLFRPAQNCAKHYGHGIQILEILTLNEETYKEIRIQAIFPDWDKDMISTHTLNYDHKLTLIDAKIKTRKF